MPRAKSDSMSWKVAGLPEIEFLSHRDPSNYSVHIHEGFNIDYLQSGLLSYRIGIRSFLVHPGNFVWVNQHAVHGARSLSKNVFIKSLFLSESFVQDLASDRKSMDLNFEPLVRDVNLGTQIALIHGLSRICSDALEIETRLVEVLSAFLLAFSDFDLLKQLSGEHQAVHAIKEYLLDHYAENVSLGRLASLVQLNRSYLVRVFKTHVGLPPYSYLTQIRVAKARNLLLAGMPLAEVAAAVGFSDQSHLTRFFKRSTGTTPRRFTISNGQNVKEILPLW